MDKGTRDACFFSLTSFLILTPDVTRETTMDGVAFFMDTEKG